MEPRQASLVARTLVVRVLEQRALATASKTPDWKRLHRAADLQQPRFEALVERAFREARQVLPVDAPPDQMSVEIALNDAMLALESRLTEGLSGLLLDT